MMVLLLLVRPCTGWQYHMIAPLAANCIWLRLQVEKGSRRVGFRSCDLCILSLGQSQLTAGQQAGAAGGLGKVNMTDVQLPYYYMLCNLLRLHSGGWWRGALSE